MDFNGAAEQSCAPTDQGLLRFIDSEMDICGETLIGFVCAHCDAFEFLELAVLILNRP
jgi:hypothetical protein